jgi:prophage regulatory protein
MGLRLLRIDDVERKHAGKKSRIYAQIKEGVFVPPVRLGLRISVWPEHEVDAILAARVAGESDEGVRALVTRLVAERKLIKPKEFVP